MALGPGKYDDLCTHVRETAKAEGALVIVVNGSNGSGFSCQAGLVTTAKLPTMLRIIADQIEADISNRRSMS
jgi:hypothetical protein